MKRTARKALIAAEMAASSNPDAAAKAREFLDAADMWIRLASQARCDEAHDEMVDNQNRAERMAKHFDPAAHAAWEAERFPQ